MRLSVTKLRPVVTHSPYEMVVMDTGYVTLPSGRKKYFLATVETFTKWVEFRAVASETGVAVAKFLREEIFDRHGFAEQLFMDNGSLLRSCYEGVEHTLGHSTSTSATVIQ